MAAKSKSREPLPRKPKSVSNTEEKISLRAYELYEQRGRIDGHALDDWLQAEAEIVRRQRQPRNVRPREPK